MLIKLSHAELMQLPGKIIYMQQAQKMSFAFAFRVSCINLRIADVDPKAPNEVESMWLQHDYHVD